MSASGVSRMSKLLYKNVSGKNDGICGCNEKEHNTNNTRGEHASRKLSPNFFFLKKIQTNLEADVDDVSNAGLQQQIFSRGNVLAPDKQVWSNLCKLSKRNC